MGEKIGISIVNSVVNEYKIGILEKKLELILKKINGDVFSKEEDQEIKDKVMKSIEDKYSENVVEAFKEMLD